MTCEACALLRAKRMYLRAYKFYLCANVAVWVLVAFACGRFFWGW